MKPKLKPCPFCGGEAIRSIKPIVENHYYDTVAFCVNCGCRIRSKISLPRWIKNPESEAKRRISLLWNRRTPDSEATN